MLGFLKITAVRHTNIAVTFADILQIPVRPISPYWYLYALATLYIAFSAKEACLCRMWPAILLPILACFSVLGGFFENAWFEIGKSLYYSFFFALGVVLCRVGERVPLNLMTTPMLGVGASVLAMRFWQDGRQINEIPVVNLVVGACLSLFFWGVFSKTRLLAKNPALCLVGRYSLEIYVLHCIFTAGHRAILPRLGVTNAFTGTMVNLIVSVLLPILIGVFCKSVGVHGLFFRPITFFCGKQGKMQTGR